MELTEQERIVLRRALETYRPSFDFGHGPREEEIARDLALRYT